MLPNAEKIRELVGLDPRALPDDVLESAEPLVVRGLVRQWPLVRAGLESDRAAFAYLLRFCRDATVGVITAPPAVHGRFFYNDDLTGFNFESARVRLDAVLARLQGAAGRPEAGAIYVGSTTIDTALPGLRAENDLALDARRPLASIWIGNRVRIAAHHDVPDNLACVAVGHRRFTLLPPEQIANLYVGPLELTPAGQPVSLVDFANPDLARFPKFAQALRHARVAELGPGDAIVIPSMWWHHIESLDDFNVLVNYWWRRVPLYMDSPIAALMFALMTVRDLPPEQRAAWHSMFRHYVFEASDETVAHIPEKSRQALGALDADVVRRLRAHILARLQR